jgi:hypothetical protein
MTDTPFGPATATFVNHLVGGLEATTEVRFGPPRSIDEEPGIDVTFLRLSTERAIEDDSVRRIAGRLHVVVSIDHRLADPIGLLDRIIGHLDQTAYELDPAPVEAPWWLAHGVAPRPAVGAVIPGAIDKPLDDPALVVEVAVEATDRNRPGGRNRLAGQVLLESGRPATGARVAVVGQPDLAVRADDDGRFAIDAVFARSTVAVEVRAGRLRHIVDLAIDTTDNPPITLTSPLTRA